MRKTTLSLGLLALIIFSGAGLYASSVMAYRGDSTVKGPNYTEERHTDMKKAFEDKDYNAWKSLMAGKGRVTEVINQNNFAKFAEAHTLAEQGKTEEAQKLRQELGLGLKNGSGCGLHNGSGNGAGRMGADRSLNR